MERKEKTVWKNNGGPLRLANKKIIAPGKTFEAYEREISLAFRDTVVPVGGKPVRKPGQEEKSTVEVTAPEYEAVHTGAGWYNVVDSSGKVLNETKLRIDAAEQLIKDLTM